MVNICACVCAFGSHAKGLPGATPVLGTAIPSPTSQLIAARRISPFAKAEFSLPIFLWSRPRAGSGEKARPSPTRPGGFALLFTSLPSPGPPAVLPHTHSREKALKNVLFVVVFQKTSASPLGVWQRPRTGASSVGVLLLLLAGEAGQPGAHQHGRRRTPARAVVGPADVAGPQFKLVGKVTTGLSDFFTVPAKRIEGTTRANQQTPQELDASCHPAHGPGDELRHTAAHERRQGHQEEQPTAQARHHRADPPLGAWDGLEGGIAATLLHHHRRLAALIPDWVGTPPESAEGNRLLQLRPQEPVGHEEAHTGGSGTEEGEEGPDNTGTGEAGGHLYICSRTPRDGETEKQLCILEKVYG